MNFNEARRALGVMSQFLRAFRVLDEVLEEGDKAMNAAKLAREQEQAARSEIDKILSETTGIRDELAKQRQLKRAMITEAESQAKEKYEGLVAHYQSSIEALKADLTALQATMTETAKAHEDKMAEYAATEGKAAAALKSWDSKLAAAQKAYETFKEKVLK